MDSFEAALREALGKPVPSEGFFDDLLGTLRQMWELPTIAEAPQRSSHGAWVVAGSVAAAASAAGAAGVWYGIRRRHRRRGAA